MTTNILSRLGTDTPLISDLIADVRKGEIKIPQFQRKFVWKEKQALDLLDSISKNYPVGSLLLWKTKVKLAAERNIGNFKLPQTDDLTPTDYVLDGQQRITVIYSCLGASDEEEGFAAGYDLEQEIFIQNSKEYHSLIFPLRWMFNTTKMLNFRTGLMSHPGKDKYQDRFDSLLNAFTNYRIPVVTLKDLSIEEVCPIFERINSSGTKLSTYDLMVAATWSQQFNLDDKVRAIAESIENKNFAEIDNDTILKCLSAVKFRTVRKEQIINLRTLNTEQMEDLVKLTKESLLSTADLLSTEFRIASWDFVPYESIAVILCYIFSLVRTLSPEKIKRVRQWFWRASFSERYRGGESIVSNDLLTIHDFVVNEVGQPKSFGLPPEEDYWKKIVFRSNNSRTRAYILALALRRPRNLTNGAVIDTASALSQFNKKQFHHIYPRAYLKRIEAPQEHNAIANICMLAASENNWISDANPNAYLPMCVNELGESAEDVFASNLLPSPTKFNFLNASYDEFLNERSKIIGQFVNNLCEGNIH
jgi:hypothetical protein